jgi:hypothetical protein
VIFLAIMFGGLMVAMAGKMADVRWLTFTGIFAVLIGMFLMAAAGMMREYGAGKPRRRSTPPRPKAGMPLPADTTNKLLPVGETDFIPSVTEHTTNLLKVEVKK